MVMSRIWTLFLAISILCSIIAGTGPALSGAAMEGAQAGVSLAIAMCGSVCLWTGVSRLMESIGITDSLARLLKPVLHRLFPSTHSDEALARDLSGIAQAKKIGTDIPAEIPGQCFVGVGGGKKSVQYRFQ